MPREKIVYDTDMIGHLWANQSQHYARNKQDNFSFRGPNLYSYATVIAKLVRGKNRTAVLHLNCNAVRTRTTNKHQSTARRSSCQHLTFRVREFPERTHKTNLADYKERIAELAIQTQRARSNKGLKLNALKSLVEEANNYAKFYGLKTRFHGPSDEELQKRKEQAAIEKAKEEKRQKQLSEEEMQRKAERMQKHEEDRVKWLAGEAVKYTNYWGEPILLRIRGSRIETSQGAVVSIESAKALLPLVRAGQEWKANGHQLDIDTFPLTSVSVEGDIVIGCHKISRAEIERIAAQIGA